MLSVRCGFVSRAASAFLILSVFVGVSTLADAVFTFTAANSMSTPRAGVEAIMLDDGRVLLAGDGNTGTASETYDANSGSFVVSGDLSVVRAGAAVVPIDLGRVAVIGGRDAAGVALDSAEIYDPATGVFSPVAQTMSVRRANASAVRMSDGRILIAGGHNGTTALATAEIFDPSNGTFTPTGSMITARVAPATSLPDGTVLIAGGLGNADTVLKSAEIYSAALGGFAETSTELVIARHGHQITRLSDGSIMITGGQNAGGNLIADSELFDAGTGTFTTTGALITARTRHRTAILADGQLFIVGGVGASGTLKTTEVYDPATGAFVPAANLTEPRSEPSVAVLADGRVLVAGGRDAAGNPLATTEIYDALRPQGTSTTLTSMPVTSTYGQAVTYRATVSGDLPVSGGQVRFVDGESFLLGTATVDEAGVATLTTTLTPFGVRAVTAFYDGSPTSSASRSTITQTVNKSSSPTTATLAVSPLIVQYSDIQTYDVTVSGAFGGPPADGVNFKVALQQMNDEPVTFLPAGPGVWKAKLATPLLEKSPAGQLKPNGVNKIVTATLVGVNPGYTLNNPTSKAVLVTKEDARPTYDGPRAVLTNKGTGKATIKLRAIVRDISATLENNGDLNGGDVRLAQVMFYNRTNNTVIGTVTVTLLDPAVTTVGVATFDWTVDIGSASSKSFTIGFVVANYYNRNSVLDNATVVVTRQP